MTDSLDVRTDLRSLLDAVESAPPVDAVGVMARELARMVQATDVSFLIADFSGGGNLIRFETTPSAASEERGDDLSKVPLPGSPYEEALTSQTVSVERQADGSTRLYAPVTDRGDAIGILELALEQRPSDDVVTFIASAAHALAYVIIANRRHTDLFERGQRNLPFSLAAEIQRRLLPGSFTCEAAQFTVAGWLEPASEVGGDTFDYSVERDILHLSISDARGHTIQAAQLATLAVASLRNTRRSLSDVKQLAQNTNQALFDNGDDEDFVSALLFRIDLATGVAAIVNAGHPVPYLVRDNKVSEVTLEADLPFGMMKDTVYREQSLELLPGDRLFMLTDGMLERNATSLDVKKALEEVLTLHPREVVHSFAREVLEVTGGQLHDDATMLCVDWYGEQGKDGRTASAGSSQDRASDVLDVRQ